MVLICEKKVNITLKRKEKGRPLSIASLKSSDWP